MLILYSSAFSRIAPKERPMIYPIVDSKVDQQNVLYELIPAY